MQIEMQREAQLEKLESVISYKGTLTTNTDINTHTNPRNSVRQQTGVIDLDALLAAQAYNIDRFDSDSSSSSGSSLLKKHLNVENYNQNLNKNMKMVHNHSKHG